MPKFVKRLFHEEKHLHSSDPHFPGIASTSSHRPFAEQPFGDLKKNEGGHAMDGSILVDTIHHPTVTASSQGRGERGCEDTGFGTFGS